MHYSLKMVPLLKNSVNSIGVDFHAFLIKKNRECVSLSCQYSKTSLNDNIFVAHDIERSDSIILTFSSADALHDIEQVVFNWTVYEELKESGVLIDVMEKSFFNVYHVNFELTNGNNFILRSKIASDALLLDQIDICHDFPISNHLNGYRALYGSCDTEWYDKQDSAFYSSKINKFDHSNTKRMIDLFGSLPAEVITEIYYLETSIVLHSE